ncbi:hypothetical protein ACS0TY_000515 [Phlomoides rotata]
MKELKMGKGKEADVPPITSYGECNFIPGASGNKAEAGILSTPQVENQLQFIILKPQKAFSTPWKSGDAVSSKGKPSNFIPEKVTPTKRLTPAEMEQRKKKNLCFNCDETFFPGHKCKKLFVIMMDDEREEEEEMVLEEVEDEVQSHVISFNAMAGHSTPDTIKITGKVGPQTLTILLDTGSTHSFIDPYTAGRLGCAVEYTNPLLVTVADVSKMECNSKCSKFEWEMGNCKFTILVRVIKLGGCDMVLGVDLLSQLGQLPKFSVQYWY